MTDDDAEHTLPRTAASALLEELGATLAGEIPISRALGIHPLRYDGTELALGAPLEPNLNHKHTAFGGSLYCAAVLAGWGLLHLQWRQAAASTGPMAQIVIQNADIDYRHAVEGDFEAVCPWPVDSDPQRLWRTLERRGRARIELAVHIGPAADPAVRFSGRYVVLAGRHAQGAG